MSGGWYDKLAQAFDNTKDWDPVTPNVIEALFKNDSRAMESLGSRWNIAQLEKDAQWNQENPSQGIARASTATGLGFLGAGLGNWLSPAAEAAPAAAAPTAAQTASLTAEQMATMSAEELAKYMASQAPQGFANTMEAGLLDTGYTPSSLWNAAKYGPESGQSFGQTMGNYGRGLLSKATSPGVRQEAARRYAMRQGMDMMTPEQPMQAPPQRFQQPQEPMRNPYQTGVEQELTEEEKQRLRAMGYQIPY